MNTTSKLESSARAFCEEISQLAFTNPYTSSWAERYARLVGSAKRDDEAIDWTTAERELAARVRAFLEALANGNGRDIRAYPAVDQLALRHVLLYDIYAGCIAPLDELVVQQFADPTSEPVVGDWAGEILLQLQQRGFTSAAAAGYFAWFYQLRRARYAIALAYPGRSGLQTALRQSLWDAIFTHDVQSYERYLWQRMDQFPLLLLGAPGAGKQAMARLIGEASLIPYQRDSKRFACSLGDTFSMTSLSVVSESGQETVLWGDEGPLPGFLFDGTDHGVIYLDGLAGMSPRLQRRLALTLQQRKGPGDDAPRVRRRIVAGMSPSDVESGPAGGLVPELWYRLATRTLHVPSLHEHVQADADALPRLITQVVAKQLGTAPTDLVKHITDQLVDRLGAHYEWPGNVRELGQAVRSVLISGQYEPRTIASSDAGAPTPEARLLASMKKGLLTATELQAHYCALLYDEYGTYGEVARRVGLDWRTVKKYVDKRESF